MARRGISILGVPEEALIFVWRIDTLNIIRGDTIFIDKELTPAELELVDQRTGLWFTVKNQLDDVDEDAVIQITEGGGLIRLNGAVPTNSSWGRIAIEDVGDPGTPIWIISLTIEAQATALLGSWNSYFYHDFQMRKEGRILTIGAGRTYIIRDRTRAL